MVFFSLYFNLQNLFLPLSIFRETFNDIDVFTLPAAAVSMVDSSGKIENKLFNEAFPVKINQHLQVSLCLTIVNLDYSISKMAIMVKKTLKSPTSK
jgi:uncharacterized protein (DUF2344 family)